MSELISIQTVKISQQRSIKHTHKTKDRVTLTRLKTGENSSKHNFAHVYFIFATRLIRKRWKKAKNPVSLRVVLIQ
jgi:hypothetical protein